MYIFIYILAGSRSAMTRVYLGCALHGSSTAKFFIKKDKISKQSADRNGQRWVVQTQRAAGHGSILFGSVATQLGNVLPDEHLIGLRTDSSATDWRAERSDGLSASIWTND